MFSFREPKMRMWAGGIVGLPSARALFAQSHCTLHSLCTCTYIALYVYNIYYIIIYCVYRYALQRAALLMSLLYGLSFNSSPDRGGRVRWQEPSAETRTPPLPHSLLLEFCSVRGVYIIIHYTYTLLYVRTALSIYNILRSIKTIPYISFVFNLYITLCTYVYSVVYTIYYAHFRLSVSWYFVDPTILYYNL